MGEKDFTKLREDISDFILGDEYCGVVLLAKGPSAVNKSLMYIYEKSGTGVMCLLFVLSSRM